MVAVVSLFVQVEGWLNRIQSRMRSSLRTYMSEAVSAYEEKPRDQWLFDYPAQVSLCGTQIWWTTEVGNAFERLEEVTHTLARTNTLPRALFVHVLPKRI